MADNSSIPVASGNETFANNDIGGVKYPRVKLVWGAAGAANDASSAAPIPVVLGAGTANIGDVDIISMPSVTVTGIPTTATDRGAGPATANTQRVVIVTEQVEGGEYKDIAASTSSTTLGATGGVGDFLSHIIVFPENVNPGAITLQDGSVTAVTIFAGGTGSVSNLIPFNINFGHACIDTTTPGWKIVTGAGIHIRAVGNFT